MPCENYKPALIEAAITGAAATGAELPPALRAHTAACPSCAAELAEQRSLLAAITANLHRQMNAPVPAATLHRLEARVAQQPQPKRSPRFAQVFAATFATLAIASTIFLIASHTKRGVVVPTPLKARESVSASSPPRTSAEFPPQPKTPNHSRTRSARTVFASTRQEPEVLVPPDERIALEHFIANLRGGESRALAYAIRVPEQHEQKVVPVVTPELQIASLTVPPIRESDTTSFTNSNK